MKILIVGTGYIGKNFAEYAAAQTGDAFEVETVDSREGWAKKSFEGFDSVVFTAGVAHRKQTKKNAHLYFAVNRDLAVAVAQKAKSAKVPQFVYISSMAVFGKKQGEISANTSPAPAHTDYYGTSKLHAEEALINLQDVDFSVAIARPPMVYGENCPGKYRTLAKIAKFLPLIPCNKNKRSVIYIDKLSAFLCAIIKGGEAGFFHPQDDNYAATSGLIAGIRRENGKKSRIFGAGVLIRLCMAVFPPVKNAFSSLYYTD